MKKPSKITRVGIIANPDKAASRAVVRRAAQLMAKAGRKVLCDPVTAAFAGWTEGICKNQAELARQTDLLMVCGGDGTILQVVREIAGATTPIFGVNAGRLGFLTAVPSQKLAPALQKIWAGDYTVESRPLLDASGVAGGKKFHHAALNDIVISRGAVSRMIELDVAVNGEFVTRYRCDGLIVSSPTGSTAYSLSAGGAIISPDARVFAITPICPHALTNRSVIVGWNSVITVKVLSETVDTHINIDGQVQHELDVNDVVAIRSSRAQVRLLQLGDASFFETVRHKLHWSGSHV